MKTTLTRTAVVLGVALGLGCAGLAWAEKPVANQTTDQGKTVTGAATAVDQMEKTVSVKSFWGVRTFNVANDCKVSLQDKPEASLGELRAGQKLKIRYDKTQGVPVAREIAQENIVLTGSIEAVDPAKRTLTIKHRASVREFALAEDAAVVFRGDKKRSLNDLKVGESVNVIYEQPGEALLATRIEQRNETFIGTIQALDAEARTVKAKGLASEKKFNLAKDCNIVLEGKPQGKLSDLRIGDQVVFSYEDASGVLVASRIAREPQPAEDSQAARWGMYPPY